MDPMLARVRNALRSILVHPVILLGYPAPGLEPRGQPTKRRHWQFAPLAEGRNDADPPCRRTSSRSNESRAHMPLEARIADCCGAPMLFDELGIVKRCCRQEDWGAGKTRMRQSPSGVRRVGAKLRLRRYCEKVAIVFGQHLLDRLRSGGMSAPNARLPLNTGTHLLDTGSL